MSPVQQKANSVDALVEAIREDIMTGVLGPGQHVSQDGFAERMHVSRTPVRLALERLEAEGFVRLLPRRGAVITEMTVTHLEDVLSSRLLLESGLGRAAARNLTDDDLRTLAAIAKKIDAVVLPEGHPDLVEPSHQFNVCLYQAANAPMMNRLAMQVVDHAHLFLNRYWYAKRRLAQVTKLYYAELFKACKARDPERVERLMRDHRIDVAGVILQDRVRTPELRVFPGILSPAEFARLSTIVDDGGEPLGPARTSGGRAADGRDHAGNGH
jgi:DNA-binding GntR family transcriptional regulator